MCKRSLYGHMMQTHDTRASSLASTRPTSAASSRVQTPPEGPLPLSSSFSQEFHNADPSTSSSHLPLILPSTPPLSEQKWQWIEVERLAAAEGLLVQDETCQLQDKKRAQKHLWFHAFHLSSVLICCHDILFCFPTVFGQYIALFCTCIHSLIITQGVGVVVLSITVSYGA